MRLAAVIMLLLTLAVPARAVVIGPDTPCGQEAVNKQGALDAYLAKAKAADEATRKATAATDKKDAALKAMNEALDALHSAAAASDAAEASLAYCQSTKPRGGCAKQRQTFESARKKWLRVQEAEIRCGDAYFKALTECFKAEADMRAKTDAELAAREKYQRAVEAHDKCVVEKYLTPPPGEDSGAPKPEPPKKRNSG